MALPGIPERATLDCIFKSLLKRAPSSVVDVDAVEEERKRYLNLLESCDLADTVKEEFRARLDALAFSTYYLPSQPWVTSSPFIDLVNLEGQSIALHCQKLPSRCLRVDSTGRVVATEAARTWAWKVVELMPHVITVSGRAGTTRHPLLLYSWGFEVTRSSLNGGGRLSTRWRLGRERSYF